MPFLFFAAIALIGAAIHRHRDSQPHSAERTLEIFLVWWMVVAVGIAAIFGALFHFFDGPTTAREIGFTNGDGGFQTEVGFADLAIGALGVLCARFDRLPRRRLWPPAPGRDSRQPRPRQHRPHPLGRLHRPAGRDCPLCAVAASLRVAR
jgi:hypothetical protein